MAKTKKDPYEALPTEWKDALEGMGPDELKQRLAEVAKSEEANQSAKKADEDLNNLKEQVKNASLGYNEVSKVNRLKTKLVIRHLADKGDVVAQSIIQNDISAEMQKSS